MEVSSPRSVRYHALDIWRGIVCLVVVLEHAAICLWSVPPGLVTANWQPARDWLVWSLSQNVGAPLFFVISGYCIAASLDSTRRKGISPARFIGRRLWRIFPPYWASMAIIAGAVVLLNATGLGRWHTTGLGLELFNLDTFGWLQWLGNFSLTETWRPRVLPWQDMRFLNRVAWALCYQEQFYLICFVALVFFPNQLYKALGVATVLIVGFKLVVVDVRWDQPFIGFFPDLWHEFAVGLMLYWRINVATTPLARRTVEALFVGLFGFATWKGMITTQAAALFGLLLLGCYRWDEPIARVKRFDPLRALGKRSYSVYLIHLPICTIGNAALAEAGLNSLGQRLFLMIPLVMIGSVVAAWVFYATVDRHFGNLPIVGRFGRLIEPPAPDVAVPHARV